MSETKTIYPNVTAWPSESVAAFESSRDDILVLDRATLEVDVVEILAGRVHEYRASVTRHTVMSMSLVVLRNWG